MTGAGLPSRGANRAARRAARRAVERATESATESATEGAAGGRLDSADGPERRPLRVLLLCDRLDVAGGVERFVCTLANHLAVQEGVQVTVGSVATPRGDVHFALHAGVRVVRGTRPLPTGSGALALLRKQWCTGRALAALARAEAPDAVVLNGLTTACSALLADGLGVGSERFAPRTVCCDHNHFGARSRPWQWLRARLYRRVAAVVSLTQADAARFAAINPRTEVIANASSLRADAPAAVADAVVLAVARHVAQKGIDLLLDAWVLVVRDLPAARLRVVGDGPLQPALQAQAARLSIAGSVDWLPATAAMAAQYRAAAVFVLPSRYEGMPLALLEAQALGVPAVAFDCPTGPADIIATGRAGETGILVTPGDVPGLAQAIVVLLGDGRRRARMGAAAIARSQATFSPAQHLQRWTALLQRVAHTAATPGAAAAMTPNVN